MAKTFQMGAKMTLKDQFKSTISRIASSTLDFKKNVDNTNRSVKTYKDSMGRLRDETGRYVSSGNRASAMSRTWISANGKLNSSFSLVSRGIKGAVAAFGLYKAKNWLIDANADMEQYRNTLTVVLKDEKKAIETLAWAEKFAAKTPFEIPAIIEATTRMSAYGINAQKTLGIVGDMASVMGKDLMQAVEAVADAQTGELERLKEFGITKKMIEDQAKAMKVVVTNNKGQITDQKAFNAVLFKLMDERFKGGMEMQSKTLKGMISNFQDFIGKVGRTLGKPIFDAFKNSLGGVLDFLGKLEDTGALDKLQAKVAQGVALVGKVVGIAKTIVVNNINAIRDRIAAFVDQNGAKIAFIWTTLKNVFTGLWTAAQPVLNWLANNALPLVVQGLSTVAGWVIDIATWFIKNWSTVGPIVIGIAAAVLTFSAYLKISAAVTKAYSAITTIWAARTQIMTVAQWALNAALTANPIGIIIAAVVGLIAVFIYLWKTNDGFRNAMIAAFTAVKNFFVKVWETMKAVAIGVWNAIKGPVLMVFNIIKVAFMVLFTIVKTYVMVWLTIFKVVFNIIKAVVMAVWTVIKVAFTIVFNIVKTYVMIWLAIFKFVFGIIKAIATVVWTVIKVAFIVAFNIIKAVFTAVIMVIVLALIGLKTIFTAVFNVLKVVATAVWNAIKSAFLFVWGILKTVFMAWFTVVKTYINIVLAIFRVVFNAVKSVVVTVFNAAKGIVQGFVGAVSSIVGTIGGIFQKVFNGVWNTVQTVVGWITGAWQGMKDAFAAVWTGIMAVVKAPINFLIGAINTIVKGINSISIDVPDWVPLIGGKKFGFSIPEIPYLAKGTNNWQGGPAFMNERGGELAILPGGSQVIPADKTDKIMDQTGASKIEIQNFIGKLEIVQKDGEDSDTFINRLIALLLEKLKEAAEIANNGEMGVLVNG